MKVKLYFYDWFQEPPYDLQVDEQTKGILKLMYDPREKSWVKEEMSWKEQ